MIQTTSLCPICYKIIPANIVVNDNVTMYKHCLTHGDFSAIVECDPLWYMFCLQNGSRNIYDGYMLDITDKCNLSCMYCYHKNSSTERSVESLLDEAYLNKTMTPFLLSGGEPTMHSQLPELVKQISEIGEVHVLTNGIKLCDERYFNELLLAGIATGNTLRIALSLHKESGGFDFTFLSLCRRLGFIVYTVLCIIDDLEQIDYYLSIYKEFSDVIGSMRLRTAATIWNNTKSIDKIFVSDMIKYLEGLGKTEVLIKDCNNKTAFATVCHEGMNLCLVSWYDKYNIDLGDITCGPYCKAKDGNIYNILTSFIINERFEAINTLKKEEKL